MTFARSRRFAASVARSDPDDEVRGIGTFRLATNRKVAEHAPFFAAESGHQPPGARAPSAFLTLSRICSSVGNPVRPFDATTLPATEISKIPEWPFTSFASTSRAFFSAAAARVACERYPQTPQ
jgi:hypothetical protein